MLFNFNIITIFFNNYIIIYNINININIIIKLDNHKDNTNRN